MIARIFTDLIRKQLTCKPGYEDAIGMVDLHGFNPAARTEALIVFPGAHGQAAMMKAIDAEISECQGLGIDDPEFVVHVVYGKPGSQRHEVYLVNTEGYDYARYIGKLSAQDTEAFLIATHAVEL